MDFGSHLSMLEAAEAYEAVEKDKVLREETKNSLTEAPVLVSKADAEPDTGPKKDEKETELEANPAEEALKEASLVAQQAAKKAAAAVSQLGGKLSTWWTNFEPTTTEVQTEARESSTKQAPPAEEVNLQSTFGLGSDENLIEAFACTLVQTYRCYHNSYTDEIVQSHRGTLYITEKHTCFSSLDAKAKVAFSLEHEKVTSVLRQNPSGQSATLRLVQSSENWIAITDFESNEELESAFALLEHKTDETS